MRTLVVVPTYCEADNIVEVLDRIRAAVPQADVLVVDDGSPDGTAELALAFGGTYGGVAVLHRSAKSGLGAAYRAGFEAGLAGGYDVLVEMDADLSHDPASLPELLAAIAAGADVAIGSRYVEGGRIPDWPLHRRMLSRNANRYAAAMLGLDVGDATSGYRAYRAEVLARIDVGTSRADGYGFQVELTHRARRAGAVMVEVPIAFTDRVRGTSKMSTRIIIEAAVLVAHLRAEDRRLARRAATRTPAPTAVAARG